MAPRDSTLVPVSAPSPAAPSAVTAPSTGAGASRLPALDGLRAVAVATVVLYHAGVEAVPADLGVQLFFVLSGFLITRLLVAEFESTSRVDYRAFVVRRAFRILPAYYAFLIGSFVLDRTLGVTWSGGMLSSSLTYLYNYWSAAQGAPTTTLSHTWSLAVEEHFYILWPIAFLLLARRGRRVLAAGCAMIIAVVLVWRCMLWWKTGSAALVYNRSDTRIDSILVGCLLACLWSSSVIGHMRQWMAAAWMPVLTALLLLLVRRAPPEGFHYSVGFTLEALCCALLIVQLMHLSATRMWRWLDSRLARWIGALSYSIYLWHGWGVSIGTHLPAITGVRLAGGVGATVGLAALSHYLIERPALAIRARRTRRWPMGVKLVPAP